jgi:hypothetical protein
VTNLKQSLVNTMREMQRNSLVSYPTAFEDVTEQAAVFRRKNSTNVTLKALFCSKSKTQINVVKVGDTGMVRVTVYSAELENGVIKNMNYPWEFLQWCKAEAGYGEYDACEIYPKDEDVMNQINQRHLWVFVDVPAPTFITRTEETIQVSLEDMGLTND